MTVRVAVFAPWLTTGGTQRHLQQVVAHLDSVRFRTHVYTLRPGGEVEDELRAAGVPVTSLAVGGGLAGPRSIRAILSTARALRRAKVDIVHGYQWRPALIGAVVGRLAGVPVRLASKRSLTGDDGRARRAWRRIARQVDTVLVNADALRVEGERLGMRCRWALLQNGIDAEAFRVGPGGAAARSAVGLDPNRPAIGTVGRLEERKGHDQLLLALQRFATGVDAQRPQGLFVGDGPLRGRLEAQARELGLGDDVRFAGTVRDVRPFLAAMDVFVLPSLAEGMSNALMEAMAAARPVVATAVGGNPELIAHRRTGLLVAPGDAAGIADAVQTLLRDEGLAHELAAAAQTRVAERYGARARIAELERLYLERLALRSRRAA